MRSWFTKSGPYLSTVDPEVEVQRTSASDFFMAVELDEGEDEQDEEVVEVGLEVVEGGGAIVVVIVVGFVVVAIVVVVVVAAFVEVDDEDEEGEGATVPRVPQVEAHVDERNATHWV